jgi:EAL and modified HD-GYP domain-containing signal transduction protein
VGIADFLKIDIKRTPIEVIAKLIERFGRLNCHFMAEKVETREDFEFAKGMGFHEFEGFFFRKPEIMRARGAQTNRVVFLRLLATVSKPELDWKDVEEAIKADPTLYLRLLRYLNSAIFGLRGEIRSVSQALTFLGEAEVRRWIRLIGMLELSQNRPSDLALASLVRARFGELIGAKAKHGSTDLFQVGLFSVMDAILEIPMREVLEGLPLDHESKTLLLENKGPLLPVYNLILAVEAGVWPAIVSLARQLGLEEAFVAECHWNAMEWAQTVISGA